jgi:hypothetical protein
MPDKVASLTNSCFHTASVICRRDTTSPAFSVRKTRSSMARGSSLTSVAEFEIRPRAGCTSQSPSRKSLFP